MWALLALSVNWPEWRRKSRRRGNETNTRIEAVNTEIGDKAQSYIRISAGRFYKKRNEENRSEEGEEEEEEEEEKQEKEKEEEKEKEMKKKNRKRMYDVYNCRCKLVSR